MRIPIGLFILLGSSACRTDESTIKAYNALPTISIQSHTDGAMVLDGLPETFYALASDSNHSADELQVAWFYGEDIICTWEAPDEGGGSTCDITPNQQEFMVRVEVRDPENAGALDEVSLTIQPSYPPEIALLSPSEGEIFSADDNIQFAATVSDTEDAAEDLTIRWSSSLEGALTLDTTVDSNGEMSDYTQLMPGEHVIVLEVEDTMGKTTTEEVQITINEVNQPPLCEITTPTDGSSGLLGTNVDANSNTSVGRVHLASELTWVKGTTTLPEAVFVDQTFEVNNGGGVLRLWLERPSDVLGFELGYASGDANRYDHHVRNFQFDPNYRVGMLIFPTVNAQQMLISAQNASDPEYREKLPRGVDRTPSAGAVENALYLTPAWVHNVSQRASAELRYLAAWRAAPSSDIFRTGLNGGVPTNHFGGQNSNYLGQEVNLAFNLTKNIAGFETRLTGGLGIAWLGETPPTANGRVYGSTVRTEITW